MFCNRRQMIQGIGATIILGLIPKFIPALIGKESHYTAHGGIYLSGRDKLQIYKNYALDQKTAIRSLLKEDTANWPKWIT